MGKILVIKVGEALETLLRDRGDFEDWVLSGMEIKRERSIVVDVRGGSPLPSYEDVSGIVIPGSHDMVTDHQEWSERTAAWLSGAVDRRIPILGICYGHQLLAYALGGEVGNNSNGREFGTVEVNLHGPAKRDLLFGGFSNSIRVHACHTQSVLSLPPGSTLLAHSESDPNQAFVLADRVWGVQFHPEFDAGIVIAYINHYRQELREQGTNPDQLIRDCVDTPYGPALLRRFAEIIEECEKT
jgi:GMP synthase (glutamine-hydrolysing)